LNKQWKVLADSMERRASLPSRPCKKLWLSYRDAKCAFIKGDGTDMMAYMNAADCTMDETARRASNCATSNSRAMRFSREP